jgi:hypothetical protein
MAEETFFDLPNVPEEFGVKLPTADLRRINFTALEYDTLVRACVEYIKTYYPGQFNDWVENNGIVMLIDLISFVGSALAERGEVLAQESFLPTAFSRQAVSNHLQLIDETLRAATPATVNVEVSVPTPLATSLNIPPGVIFSLTGADGRLLTYELYRAPDNWTDPITILPGKRGVVAFGIEGKFETPLVAVSAGGPDQSIDITNSANIIDSPVFVDIRSGSIEKRWDRISVIERAGPNDEVFEVDRIENGIRVRFGDDRAGKAPLAGEEITITYRVGGGSRGIIGSGRINESRPFQPEPPASAPVEVTFRNNNPSEGGLDEEDIEDAKKRAPREAATIEAAVGGPEYAQLAAGYSHPVFGTVAKAVAAVRTSLNANIVEVYILAEGSEGPVKPSVGLKKGLKNYLEEINVITDEVRALDGEIKRIKLVMDVIMNKDAEASTVKDEVETAINNFFNPRNFELGQEFYLDDITSPVKSIDGVKFTRVFEPVDDILKTNKLADPGEFGVGTNELITLGEKQIRYYFEA